MEENNSSSKFHAFRRMHADMSVAVLGMVVVLLPGIIMKLLTLADSKASPTVVMSPGFSATTVLIAFVLSVCALSKSKDNAAVRAVAIITLVVCVIKLAIPV